MTSEPIHFDHGPREKICRSTEWFTPQSILNCVRAYFGHFYGRKPFIGLDPATTPDNPCDAMECFCESPKKDGLLRPWLDEDFLGVFVNPPYGKILQDWTAKILAEAWEGTHIVALLPGQRFETNYWQTNIFNDRLNAICLIRGRISFLDAAGSRHAASNLYGSMLYLFNGDRYLFAECFDELGVCFDPVRLRPPPPRL